MMKFKMFLLLAAAAPICAMAQPSWGNPNDVFRKPAMPPQQTMTSEQKTAIIADLQAYQREVEQRLTQTQQTLQKPNPLTQSFTQPLIQADLSHHNAQRQKVTAEIARVQALK